MGRNSAPSRPPNEITLCTEVYGEPPFWVPVRAPPAHPWAPLAAPSFWKAWGYAPVPYYQRRSTIFLVKRHKMREMAPQEHEEAVEVVGLLHWSSSPKVTFSASYLQKGESYLKQGLLKKLASRDRAYRAWGVESLLGEGGYDILI